MKKTLLVKIIDEDLSTYGEFVEVTKEDANGKPFFKQVHGGYHRVGGHIMMQAYSLSSCLNGVKVYYYG